MIGTRVRWRGKGRRGARVIGTRVRGEKKKDRGRGMECERGKIK